MHSLFSSRHGPEPRWAETDARVKTPPSADRSWRIRRRWTTQQKRGSVSYSLIS